MNINKFCGESDILKLPIVKGDFTYASDGRMAIRKIGVIKEYLENKQYDIAVKIDNFLVNNNKNNPIDYVFQTTPDTYQDCLVCYGFGKILKCKKCDGYGEIECSECGQEIECPKCDGRGHTGSKQAILEDGEKCGECNGVGKVIKDQETILTPKLKVSSKLLCTIFTELQNVRLYAMDAQDSLSFSCGHVYFTFDNGEGILLPLRQ